MNPSNWWGVLYGVLACLTLSALSMALFAFCVHRTPMAEPRVWTGLDPSDPDWPDTLEDLYRDLDKQPRDPA